MKKSFVISLVFILLLATSLMMKKDGAAPGYTGSPGDSLKNCTACHGGNAYNVDNWIVSNIPSSGYVPGATYTITATNREFGATRFGFEISPQDSSGNLMGSMVITDLVRTKFVGNDKYITYTENGVEGTDSAVWSFNWVAPKSEKDVVFYGGFNSNVDGHKGGDKTYLSTLTVKRNKALGVNNVIINEAARIYPNPSFEFITIEFETLESGRAIAQVYDMSGKVVSDLLDEDVEVGEFKRRFTIENIASGEYLIVVKINGETYSKRVTIAR
jgi:hypothetical protein